MRPVLETIAWNPWILIVAVIVVAAVTLPTLTLMIKKDREKRLVFVRRIELALSAGQLAENTFPWQLFAQLIDRSPMTKEQLSTLESALDKIIGSED